jgi:hypothetical protein
MAWDNYERLLRLERIAIDLESAVDRNGLELIYLRQKVVDLWRETEVEGVAGPPPVPSVGTPCCPGLIPRALTYVAGTAGPPGLLAAGTAVALNYRDAFGDWAGSTTAADTGWNASECGSNTFVTHAITANVFVVMFCTFFSGAFHFLADQYVTVCDGGIIVNVHIPGVINLSNANGFTLAGAQRVLRATSADLTAGTCHPFSRSATDGTTVSG